MILVTLGTQKQSFKRLLDYIEKSNIKDEIIVQAGHTKYKSKKMNIVDFFSFDEMEKLIDKADIIITHGGTGSIIGPLKKGKKVIVCSRLKKYGEHIDDHQQELIEIFKDEGYILELNENNDLDSLLKEIKMFKPKIYQSNTNKFKENLVKEINDSVQFSFWNKRNLFFISFFGLFFWFDVITRYLYSKSSNVSMFNVTSNLFTLSWITLLFLITILFAKQHRKIFLFILLTIFNLLFVLVLVFYSLFNSVPSFKDIFFAKEGAVFAIDALFSLNYKHVVVIIINLVTSFIVFKTSSSLNKLRNWKNIIIVFIFILFTYICAWFTVGKGPKGSEWALWDNNRYIYESHCIPKKAYMVSGLYEYLHKDLYITFFKKQSINNENAIKFINNYIKNNPKQISENHYTGLFKNKNLIFIMMETIENWMITEDNMPTLYKMRNEGINFVNHFSTNYTAGHTFNSEFISHVSLLPFGDRVVLNYAYSNNYFPYSLPNLFKNAGYNANSYHKNYGTFYNRENVHLNFGYKKHYSSSDLKLTHGYWNFDSYLIKDRYDDIVFDDKFMSFIITYSAHMPYRYSKAECKENLDIVKKYIDSNNEEYLCAMAQSHETDNFFKELINSLSKDGKLDDTVIVAFSDHYAYGMDKNLLYQLKEEDEFNFLANTPLIIWANDINYQEITKVTSTMDILPTVANLFGLNWNPNYYVGSDALDNNTEGFVIFRDFSWYDGDVYYTSDNLENEYINEVNKKINDIIKFSEYIIGSDYYKYEK